MRKSLTKFHTAGRPRHRASHVAQLPYLRSRLKAQGWRRRAAQRCGGQLCAGSRTTLLLPVSLLYEKTRTQSGTGVSVYAWKPHADGKPMPTLLTWRRGEKNTRAPLCVPTSSQVSREMNTKSTIRLLSSASASRADRRRIIERGRS